MPSHPLLQPHASFPRQPLCIERGVFSPCFLGAANHPRIFCFRSSLKSPKGPNTDASPAHAERGKSYEWAKSFQAATGWRLWNWQREVPILIFLRFSFNHTSEFSGWRGPWTPAGAYERLTLRLSRDRCHHLPMETSANFTCLGGATGLLVPSQGQLCFQGGDSLCQGSSGAPSLCPVPGTEPRICQQMEILLPPSHFLSRLKALCPPKVPLKANQPWHRCPSVNCPQWRSLLKISHGIVLELSSPMNGWVNESITTLYLTLCSQNRRPRRIIDIQDLSPGSRTISVAFKSSNLGKLIIRTHSCMKW